MDVPRPWSLVLSLVLLSSLLFAFGSPANADVCDISTSPAATLLFPYFEVDLANAEGRTTLISINHAEDEATVARVTLWSNVGLPTLGFDLVLGPRDVQSINLRNLLSGQIPATSVDAELADCSDPLVLPELDASDVADLVAWHTGAPDQEGLCRSIADEDEPNVATGYITVDAMNRCAPFSTYPGDSTTHPSGLRYFEDGGLGLASNRNVLWGDLILIDAAGDAAQSVAAVHSRADADRFMDSTRTFYGLGADDRAPLPSTYRGRFLSGQPAGTETSFQLWLDPLTIGSFPQDGFACDEPEIHMNPCRYVEAQAYDEAGNELGDPFIEATPVLRRLDIAENAGSGFIEMKHEELGACIILPTGLVPLQAMMIPLLSAEGRFSAATAAVALNSTCSDL